MRLHGLAWQQAEGCAASASSNLRTRQYTRWRVVRRGHRWACFAVSADAAAPGRHSPNEAEHAVLDAFWRARGVWDHQQRMDLISCLDRHAPSAVRIDPEMPLPGVGAASRLRDPQSLAEVQHVTRQLLQLHRLLGGREDVDIADMCIREPGLMWTTSADVMRRLIHMKTAGGQDVDPAKVVEAQPWLLLASHASSSDSGEQGVDWRHGLGPGGGGDWAARLAQLGDYQRKQGDAHAGFRAGDDPELGRWAAAQRTAFAEGRLPADRLDALQSLGFEFDGEAAEWERWYNELSAFQEGAGHCDVSPLASSSAFLLINWCSVQRIARRSRVLTKGRVARLEALGFDWDGSDPLS